MAQPDELTQGSFPAGSNNPAPESSRDTDLGEILDEHVLEVGEKESAAMKKALESVPKLDEATVLEKEQKALALELADRAEKAQKIAGQPEKYKVCEGCESIVVIASVTCRNCHGYRFDPSPERVIAQAHILGSRTASSVSAKDWE